MEPRLMFAAGSLDTSFGTGGELAVQFPNGQAVTVVRDSIVQPDGKIVIVGQALEGGNPALTDFAIARLNPDGSPDLTFNGTGIFLFPTPGNADDGTGVALQSDGKIVASATFSETRPEVGAYGLFAVGRFNTDGTVDESFGDEGAVVVNFTTTGSDLQQAAATDVLVGANDKITAIGYAAADPTTADFGIALARLNADGTADATFGTGGQALTRVTGNPETAQAGAFDAAGNIVVSGLSITPEVDSLTNFLTARFLPNGSVDTSFGDNGAVIAEFIGRTDLLSLSAATAVAVQPDGRIVAAGFAGHADILADDFTFNAALVRYNPDGTPDRTFGTRGQAESDLGPLTSVNKLLIDPTGRIVASGLSAPTSAALEARQFDPFLVQYTANGRLDRSFGDNGAVVVDVGDAAPVAAAAAPADTQAALRAVAASLVPDALSPIAPAADASQSDQAVAALRQQAAIVVALGNRLLVVTTSGNQVNAARLIGNGADLVAGAVTGVKTPSVLGGAKAAVAVPVTNNGNEAVAGTVTVRVVLSADATADPADATAATVPVTVNLRPQRRRSLKLKFDYPTTLPDGPYFLLAVLDAGAADINATNSVAAAAAPVTVARPFVNLGGTLAAPAPPTLVRGRAARLPLNLQNAGNVAAAGTVQVTVYASTDGALDTAADRVIAGPVPLRINLKANAAKASRVPLLVPADLVPGTYVLVAVVDAAAFPESDVTNNTLVGGSPVNVA